MTHKKDPLGQDALLAEASRWLAALDSGRAQDDEFEAWRRRDPANAVAYARVAANWETIAAEGFAPERSAPSQISRRQWLKTAAIGVPMAVVGSGILVQRAYAWDNAATSVGETRRISLPDGSIAHLNTDTSLSWRFGEKARALRLDRGEVALSLRGGSATTFQANGVSLPLSPGLFDARITPAYAELTIIDAAQMRMPSGGSGRALRARDTIIVEDGQSPRVETRSSEQVASQIAWRAGEIVFLDQSVDQAVADFNRYLTRKIEVNDAALAREKIGGRFDLNRPDQFLKAVSLSLNAQVVDTAAGYRLTR